MDDVPGIGQRDDDGWSDDGCGEGDWPDEDFFDRRGGRDNEVPVSIAFDAVLASTDDVALFVSGLRVYSNGVELSLELRAREAIDEDEAGGDALDSWGPDRVLLVVEYADGGRASNLEGYGMDGGEEEPSLSPQDGGGNGRSANLSIFLSPIPPPGELRMVCAWPAHGIPDTFLALPCEEIRDAVSRVRELWPWEPPRPDVSERSGFPQVPEGSWFAGRSG